MAKEVSTGIRAFVKDSLNQYYKRFQVKLDDNPSKNSNKSAIKINNDGSIYVYDIGNYNGSSLNASTLQEVIKNTGGGGGGQTYYAGDNIEITQDNSINALGYIYNSTNKSITIGYNNGSHILTNGNGAFAGGYANTGVINASGNGAAIIGAFAGANSSIIIGESGSHNGGLAGGIADSSSIINLGNWGSIAYGMARINSSINVGHGGAVAFGQANTSSAINVIGDGAFAMGYANNNGIINVSANGAHAGGYAYTGTIEAKGIGSHAEGCASTGTITASGRGAVAMGYAENGTMDASGNGAHAEGYNTHAEGNGAHAEGNGTIAGGDSHAEGQMTQAGYISHAEGVDTFASFISHAEGQVTIANSARCSHTEGRNIYVDSSYSHAEGKGDLINAITNNIYDNTNYFNIDRDNLQIAVVTENTYDRVTIRPCEAPSNVSDTEINSALSKTKIFYFGDWSTYVLPINSATYNSNSSTFEITATKYFKVSESALTTLINNSHNDNKLALCYFSSYTNGEASHIEGLSSIATNLGEHAEGKYNQSHKNQTIHSVGIGTSNTNRKNAFEVMQDGSIYVYGLNYDGSTLTNASTLQDICNSKADKIVNAIAGNLASLDAEGNLQDSGKKPIDFAPANHIHDHLMSDDQVSINARYAGHQSAKVVCDSENEGLPYVHIALENESSSPSISKDIYINFDNADNLNRALATPSSTPENNANKLITSKAVYDAFVAYEPKYIYDNTQAGEHAKVLAIAEGDGDPQIFLSLRESSNSQPKTATVDLDNIDNLQRALATPSSTPEDDDTKLITSKAVYDAIADRAYAEILNSRELQLGGIYLIKGTTLADYTIENISTTAMQSYISGIVEIGVGRTDHLVIGLKDGATTYELLSTVYVEGPNRITLYIGDIAVIIYMNSQSVWELGSVTKISSLF